MKNLPRVPYNPDFYPGYAYRKIDILVSEDSTRGEGVWCLLSPEDQILYDENKTGISCGILCNDSLMYETLKAGQVIPIKFNGEFRANVPIEWLNSKVWEQLENS